MHQAPAVRVAVGRSRWHLGCIVCGGVAAALGAGAFAWVTGQADWRFLVIFVVAALATLLALEGWLRSPIGQLSWDGRTWHWSDGVETLECRVGRFMDWQRMLLVRLDASQPRTLWLWLQPVSDADPSWLPLRRAMVSGLAGSQHPDGTSRSGSEELLA